MQYSAKIFLRTEQQGKVRMSPAKPVRENVASTEPSRYIIPSSTSWSALLVPLQTDSVETCWSSAVSQLPIDSASLYRHAWGLESVRNNLIYLSNQIWAWLYKYNALKNDLLYLGFKPFIFASDCLKFGVKVGTRLWNILKMSWPSTHSN